MLPSMAQEHLIRSFQSFANFNAQHINDINQDEKGFIWVASESGLFQFDGLRFRNISDENGVSNTIFTHLYMDKDGVLWTTQPGGRTWRIEDEKLIPQKTAIQWPKATLIPIKNTYYKHGDTLSFTTYSKEFYRFANDSLVEYSKLSQDQTLKQITRPYHKTWREKLYTFLVQNKNKLFNSLEFKIGYISGFSNDSSFLYCIGNLKLFNNKNEIDYAFDEKTIYTSQLINNYQIISKQDIGLIINKKGNIPDTLFKGKTIISVFGDKSRGIWVGTQNKGLFYIPSLDVFKYKPENNFHSSSINDIIKFKDQIVILENNSTLKAYSSDNHNIESKILLPNLFQKIVNTDNNKILIYNAYKALIVAIRDNHFKIENSISFNSPVFHATISNDDVYLVGINGIAIYSLSQNQIKETLIEQQQLNCLECWNQKIYTGNSNGLWEIDKYKNVSKISSAPVNHINRSNGKLFIQYGTSKFEIKSEKFNKVINLYENHKINHVLNVDSLIILSSNKGIRVMNNEFQFTKKFDYINHFSTNSRFNKVFIIDKQIFLFHNSGLYILPLISNLYHHNYKIQLQTQEKRRNTDNEIILFINKDLKNIHLNLSTFNYKNNVPTSLYYKINKEDKLHEIRNNELNITQFTPGISGIEISDNKSFYPNYNYLNITLKKTGYWYQNLFYQILILFIGITLIFLFFYNRVRNLKKRNKLENIRIAQMQIVLQQQMNPHFIFNSLTSINHFVLQNKPMDASRYLTKFSTLIRKILDNSSQEEVSLAEEIEALNIYMELELLRFKNKFSYNIKKSADINEHNIKIIPFIIQPIINQTIRNSILNRPDKGTLLIQFQKSENHIICNIIDNGIITVSPNPDKEEFYKSTAKSGTQIAEQRIRIYNKQHNNKLHVEHVKIKNHKDEIIGNKTTIRYPLNQ
jgi:hypothetical protein